MQLQHRVPETRTELYDAAFRCVVSRLHLWNIDDMATHASGSNEASVGETMQCLPVQTSPLLLLAFPVLSSSPTTVVNAVHV